MPRDTTKAIALFQLNADIYPSSPKAYNSLGDAWMARGDVQKAIVNFEKSAALNPRNQHARDMIRKLKSGK